MMLHPQKGVKLRSYDPTVLVYSTTEEEWAKIKESGKLTPSGKQAFPLEPDDYRQYLLLDKPQTVSEPGVRIYLDGKALFENGLIMRDGFHTAKVFYSLLLRPYLLGVVTKDDLPPQEWTAQSFTKAANDYAKENF